MGRSPRRKPTKAILRLCAVLFSCLLFTSLLIGEAAAGRKVPEMPLAVKPLDLSRPVTRAEIIAAGQLGGQIYPTHELQDKAREQEINNSFARALHEWNRHNYKHAVQLFAKHADQYPDSPWAAEAALHVGKEAYHTGRMRRRKRRSLQSLMVTRRKTTLTRSGL